MFGVACSTLGLNLDEFLQLSPNELYHALLKKKDEVEMRHRFELETMRLQTFYLINVQLPRKSQIATPKELMKFEWEIIRPEDVEVPDWDKLDEKYKGVL